MRMALRYSGTPVESFKAQVAEYPYDEFESPERSTIPSIVFWSSTEERVTEMCAYLCLVPPEHCTVEFEYKVVPPHGKGKESHTDVMLWWGTTCIGVEAKYTEPHYQTVFDWLRAGTKPENRRRVLAGWCSLIASATGRRCEPDSLADATYQMIHRIASVCSRPENQRHVVYQVFDPRPEKVSYYRSELEKLRKVLSTGSAIRLHLSKTTIRPSEVYSCLVKEWTVNKTPCTADVITGLTTGTLLKCGETTFETI